MVELIIVFGFLTLAAGFGILVSPELVLGPLRRNSESLCIHGLAVVLRFVLGVLLLSQSEVSRFPLIIGILGWLSLSAAILLAGIGRKGFKGLMAWAFSFLDSFGRLGGIFAAVFGAFLIYAFI